MSSAWDSSHGPSRLWRSGPWSVELRDDELADIRFGGRRVLRSIRAVVRDHDWATAGMVVDRISEGASTLTMHVRSEGLGSTFAGLVGVEALGSELRVVCELESAEAFQTNRTGLVVLHPHELAGSELTVTHSGGAVEKTRFPRAISPHQPVFDISGLAWHDDGLAVHVRFSGDVFEMEDQRNWSDASFKTYSRPLGLPFPYLVERGERVRQQVTIAVEEVGPPVPDHTGARIELRRGGAFPDILVGASTAPDPAPGPDPIGSGVLVELDMGSTNWRAALERAAASSLPLDVRVTLSHDDAAGNSALHELANAIRDLPVLRVGAFDPDLHVTDAGAAAALRGALAAAGVAAPVVGGTRSHFTEYNREHARMPADLDGVVFATTPLFHSLGSEQLVESLAVQRLIAEQATEMAGGTPLHVGPVTLRPRFNNVATAPPAAPTRADLVDGYGAQFTGASDPRQSAPELSAWVIASAAALSIPGVVSIAWFEEWGPRGIRTADGAETPAAEALRRLAALRGGELLWGGSPDGLVWAIGSAGVEADANADTPVVLVSNLHDEPRTVEVSAGELTRVVTVPGRTAVTVGLDTPG